MPDIETWSIILCGLSCPRDSPLSTPVQWEEAADGDAHGDVLPSEDLISFQLKVLYSVALIRNSYHHLPSSSCCFPQTSYITANFFYSLTSFTV